MADSNSSTNVTPSSSSLPTPIPLIINNLDTQTTTTFPVTSPQTHQTLHLSSSASPSSARETLQSSSIALPSWSSTPAVQRQEILLKASHILSSRADECISVMSAETGADAYFAGFVVNTAASMLKDIASRLPHVLTGSAPLSVQKGRGCVVQKHPIGVVLAFAPWNAPFILAIRAVGAALAAGCTVILKGSELSPRCFWLIGDVLRKAGLPPGVCNVIYSRVEDAEPVARTLIESKEVRKVAFTGSTGVGRKIAEMAGRALKPCLLELGGKAPAIVCEDADLEVAAREVVKGALVHGGQVCMSTERVLVAEDVVEEFKRLIGKEIEGMKTPEGHLLATEAGVKKNLALLDDAVRKGANVVYGSPSPSSQQSSKTRINPTVLESINKDMHIYHQESFGPSFTITPFSSETEAVTLANDSDYGLNAAVFSRDLAKAMKIAGQIEAGNVHINSMTIYDEPGIPHGGVKSSGWGRFNADYGIEEFLFLKTVTWVEGEGEGH